ncbi:MAG: hypothetical protein CL609_25800 [Anaerolineaceae bacterium]|nr:hypothetical protein [Anaerolineaceae bacterium]
MIHSFLSFFIFSISIIPTIKLIFSKKGYLFVNDKLDGLTQNSMENLTGFFDCDTICFTI